MFVNYYRDFGLSDEQRNSTDWIKNLHVQDM
jgi:hypothetical protein